VPPDYYDNDITIILQQASSGVNFLQAKTVR